MNDIDTILIGYNETACYYCGTDGFAANGTNYTEQMLNIGFKCISAIGALLGNFSAYQDLLDYLYYNLTLIKENLMELDNSVQDLNQTSSILDYRFDLTIQYIDEHYDIENATEDDFTNITLELFEEEEFVQLYNFTIEKLFQYSEKQNNLTMNISFVTASFSNFTLNLITELFDREAYELIITLNDNVSNDTIEDVSENNSKSEKENDSLTLDKNSSKTMDSITIPKLITHNDLLPAPNGIVAFQKADAMDIDQIRMDFSWETLYKQGEYSWTAYNDPNDPDDNHWYDLSHPNLCWAEDYSLSTLAVIKSEKAPSEVYNTLRYTYSSYWRDFCEHLSSNPPPYPWSSIEEVKLRQATLWASWAYEHDLNDLCAPQVFINGLLGQFHSGLNTLGTDGRPLYNFVGYNIENEPNVWRPGRLTYVSISIPTGSYTYIGWQLCWVCKNGQYSQKLKVGKIKEATFTTYTTADLVKDEAKYVRSWIDTHNEMKNAVTVVNLHGWGFDWKKQCWKDVAKKSYVNVLGIDLYYTHYMTKGDIWEDMDNMHDFATSFSPDKPWWLVETEGADSPANSKNPSVDGIKQMIQHAINEQVSVVGFYRLWGSLNGQNHDSAYNIYTNPGNNPTPRYDDYGKYYWEGIRDL